MKLRLYAFIHDCITARMHQSVVLHVLVRICIFYVFTLISIYVCMNPYACTYECLSARKYECIYVWLHAFVHVCLYLYAYTSVRVHAYTFELALMCICVHVCMHIYL